jgi:PPOX class probable F420-dependent enzyme
VVALQQPDEETRRLDAHLTGEPDEATRRLIVGAGGDHKHRIVEKGNQFLEGFRHRSVARVVGMARKYATADVVTLPDLLEFIRPRHRMVLTTFRSDGSPQSSPVSGGVDDAGRIVIASYPQRAKSANIRRTPQASVMVLSDEFNDAYVQVDGEAEVIDLPDAVEPLVDYYRSIAGEHPDWAVYRQAMVDQGKCLIRVTPRRWGPVATGGFPPP